MKCNLDFQFLFSILLGSGLSCALSLKSTGICSDIDFAFLNAAEIDSKIPACLCYLDQSMTPSREINDNNTGQSIWISCSGQSMPSVFRALNSLNGTEVSHLLIWNSLINILPSDMFSKVYPTSLAIESSAVSVFRKGIFTSIGNHLRTLKMNRNILKAIDNDIFNGLNSLEFLDLSENKIDKLSKANFESLPALKNLILSGNNINEIEDNAFIGLNSLEVLDLTRNKIKRLTKHTFKGLSNLKELYLRGNQLSELEPEVFSHLDNLQILDLGVNSIREIDVSGLTKLKKLILNDNHFEDLKMIRLKNLHTLQILLLDHNSITSIEKGFLQGTRSLRSLSLTGNLITNIELGAFSDFPHITTLSLQYNRLESLENLTVGLPSLSALFLSNNQIEEIGEELNRLSNLKIFAVDHNNIKQIHTKAFAGIHQLEKLFLNSNRFLSLPENIFKSLPVQQLKAVDVSENPWTCVCGRVWLGRWIQRLGPANVATASLGCLSDSSCWPPEDSNDGDDMTQDGQLPFWIRLLAWILACLSICLLATIAYLFWQHEQKSRQSLSRSASDKTRLIDAFVDENFALPNPVTSDLTTNEGLEQPKIRPLIRPEKNDDNQNQKKVTFSGV